ncbi:MAG: cysteine peptidase family C39 domain-containing protein, partial [Nitrospirales bacterium]
MRGRSQLQGAQSQGAESQGAQLHGDATQEHGSQGPSGPDETGQGNGGPPPDSGILCLLILARYFGIPSDGGQLRHQFAERGKPLALNDLLRAAKHLGFKAGVVDSAWERLANVPLPAIVPLRDGRYVVLGKLNGETALVQDPAHGPPQVVPRADFEGRWTGQVVLLTTRAGRAQDRTFDFTWFIPAIVKYRRLLGQVMVASFFLQLFALLTPLFTQVIIDKVLVHKGLTTLHVMAVGMLALML